MGVMQALVSFVQADKNTIRWKLLLNRCVTEENNISQIYSIIKCTLDTLMLQTKYKLKKLFSTYTVSTTDVTIFTEK